MNRLALLLLVLIIGCGPDPIPDPQPADLISPSNLDTCTTASRVNDFESQVRFQWTAPLHSDSYELVIQNSITGKLQSIPTLLLTESIVLPSGAPYQWYIVSKSILTEMKGKSLVWQFYLEGSPEESHFPFPAILLEPSNQEEITLNESNTYNLNWEGNDLDGDIKTYTLYIGTSENELITREEELTNSESTQVLNSNTLYFWQVESIDGEGNRSFSEIYQFQTL